ncbi:MAG: hypothetical protein FWD27_03285, partial [Coriobacteriia bacterium]|nr:hypothetical protein [Coriobacteriia bacterium]
MQHLFFINENSLRGRIGKCVQEISAVCDEHGLTHQIIITKSIAELREQVSRWGKGDRAGVGQRGDGAGAGLVWDREGTGLVQGWCGTERGRGWCPIFQRSRKWDTSPVPSLSHTSPFVPHCLLCVGGDGTLQALINAVDLTSAVIQYLPYGSGNNAYRTFYNQPFDLRRDILSNNTFTADLGCANGEYFATMLGLALDSSIGNNLAKFKWLPLPGKTKYLASALFSLLFCNEPVRLKMTVNGRTEQLTTSFVSITNGPTIGGQTPMQPYASAFDGRLNALVAQRLTPTAALRLFSQVKKGEHLHDPLVSHFEFEELLFESAENLMYEVDGEIRSASRIRV